ncbi:MAG: right-handed parallel beta-helix repeat-containing protein [Candidatus Eisenbacteria sp.]|nr:right-handed parallel beta-helix repeat-containing protein [Candidatus Eisenbacteria bacterium]
MSRLALLIIVAVALPGAAPAETYVVEPDGTGDFPTIKVALEAAADGDTIALTNGTFTGNGNRDIHFVGKAVTLRSLSGDAELCVIDCEGNETAPHNGFNFGSGEDSSSVLEDVTITGGYFCTGGAISCSGSSPKVSGVVFSANYAHEYGGAIACEAVSAPLLRDCFFDGNTTDGSGGAVSCLDSSPRMEGCSFFANHSASRGGALRCDGASAPEIRDCSFTENQAAVHGGAVYFYGLTWHSAFPSLVDVVFERNSCGDTGGALVTIWSSPTLERCVFYEDSAGVNGGAIWCGGEDAYPTLSNCTLVGSHGSTAGTIYCNAECSITLENCIIAFGTHGVPIYCNDWSVATLTCCDVFGNAGGDWVGCIADQYGINGNASLDPLFCDLEGGDLRLHENSPCAPFSPPNDACDLIGALPAGCGPVCWMRLLYPDGGELFGVGEDVAIAWDPDETCGPDVCIDLVRNDEVCLAIADMESNDGEYLWQAVQCDGEISGYRIRVTDLASGAADESNAPFLIWPAYHILSIEDVAGDQGRQVRIRWLGHVNDGSGYPAVTGYGVYRRGDRSNLASDPTEGILNGAHAAMGAGRIDGWDYIATVPARGDEIYQYVAPTLCDSTVVGGICWSVFFISAMTSDPVVYYDTPPDSGYSVDNLAPAVPGNVRLESPGLLAWGESPDADFDYSTVYGSEQDHLDPTAEVLGYTTGTSMDVSGHADSFFHLTATDFAGNESREATVAGAAAAPEGDQQPQRFALHPSLPNPGASAAVISFDVPVESRVKVRIFDLAGRQVTELLDDRLTPGTYSVPWMGRDGYGTSVASGIYFCRFEADGFAQTRRLVVAR